MGKRQAMEWGDWIQAAVNVVIAALLGTAAFNLAQLVANGAWLLAVILVLFAGSLYLIVVVSDWLMDRLFPVRIHSFKSSQAAQLKPLPRVLSLPFGFMLGILLAVLGLDRTLLDLLS
jgi:hypothetical protein